MTLPTLVPYRLLCRVIARGLVTRGGKKKACVRGNPSLELCKSVEFQTACLARTSPFVNDAQGSTRPITALRFRRASPFCCCNISAHPPPFHAHTCSFSHVTVAFSSYLFCKPGGSLLAAEWKGACWKFDTLPLVKREIIMIMAKMLAHQLTPPP